MSGHIQPNSLGPSMSAQGSEFEKLPSKLESVVVNNALPCDELSEKSETPRDREDGHPPFWKIAVLTVGLACSAFCMAVDNTILATAIPTITNQFNSFSDIGWYGESYLLTMCSLQLSYGKIYSLFPTKWVYMMAVGIFELGSLICGVAQNSLTLIMGRAVAGMGAGGIFSGSLLIISESVPSHHRPIYNGIFGGLFSVASVVGPLLGGALTDHASWRWCFYINLPLGGITALVIFFFFKPSKQAAEKKSVKEKILQLDIIGTILFLPGICCTLIALQWGGSKYPWDSSRIIALFVVAGVLVVVFLIHQHWRQDNALVPPRLIKNRNVWGSSFFSLSLGASFFILTYYLPIWFQAIKEASAVKSGIMNSPMFLTVLVTSIVAGTLVTIIGYYTPFLYVGAALMAVGAGMLSTLEINSGPNKWIGYQIIYAIGAGMGMQQAFIAVQTSLNDADAPIGVAMVIFAQSLGGAIFIGAAQTLFQNLIISDIRQSAPDVNPQDLVNSGVTAIRRLVSEQDLPAVLAAYNKATTQTFYISTATSGMALIGALFVQWKSVKKSR